MLLLTVFWGGSFLAIHLALQEVPVLTTIAHRTGRAMLVFLVVVFALMALGLRVIDGRPIATLERNLMRA